MKMSKRNTLSQLRQAATIALLAIGLTACGGGSEGGGGGTTGGGQTPPVSVPLFQAGTLSPALDQLNVVATPIIVANWAVPANGPLTSATLSLSCNGTALPSVTVAVTTNAQNVGTTTANITPAIAPGAQCSGTITASNAGGASAPVTVRFTVASLVIPKKLFMGTSSVSGNGGVPVSVIDSATGTIQNLTQFTNQVTFFDGFCTNLVTGNVHTNARANFSGVADPNGNIRFPLYNIFTGVVSAGPSLGNENSTRSPIGCAANGMVFYGRGTILGTGTSSGKLDVVENGVRTASIALDQAGNRVPSRITVGTTEIYVMNQAPSGLASSFSVVNIATKSLTRTCPIGSEAFDMDVRDGTAYVSVFRDATSGGKDVLLFNTTTCAQTGSMTMVNASSARDVYAAGIRATANGLYIATKEGVRLYSLPALTQTAFFPNPAGTFFAYELAVGGSEVYVTFPDSTIMVLNPGLTPIRTITINVGAGRIYASN